MTSTQEVMPQEDHTAVRDATAEMLGELNRAEDALHRLIELVPGMGDEQIIATLERTREVGDKAWLLIGACASEMRRRAERLPGGRGQRDEKGVGVCAVLAGAAAEMGVHPRTLEKNADIYDKFFAAGSDTPGDSPVVYPREYYEVALHAPDPQAALELAGQKFGQKNFNAEQFRLDVQRQWATERGGEPPVELEGMHWFKVPLTERMENHLERLRKRWGLRTKVDAIVEAIHQEAQR